MGHPSLQTFVDACHDKGIFVKLYFTTRELSNRCTEIFALKSLPDHEVLYGVDGTSGQEGGGSETGGGGAWLQVSLNHEISSTCHVILCLLCGRSISGATIKSLGAQVFLLPDNMLLLDPTLIDKMLLDRSRISLVIGH
jgi:hypothetical protein